MYGLKGKEVIITANLKQAKTQDEIKKLTVNSVKKAYNDLAIDYNHLLNLDYLYCPHCGEWKSSSNFYTSNKTKSGYEHFGCKQCILDMATDYDKRTHERKDNKEKTIEVFRKLDMPFIESDYNSQLNLLADDSAEKQRKTAFQQLLTLTRSLPQYKYKTFQDSEFIDEDNGGVISNTNKKPRKEIVRLFGNMPTEDLLYLQDQYDDWKSRVQIDTKPQETYLVQICLILLDIYKARMAGKDTDKLVKSLNEAMAASNLQPRQNVSNSSSDTLTFGQLIEKWETEESIEPDPEFEDVDGIKKYINVFFKGHLAKMMGLKNAYSQEYDEYMEQYTVTKPTYDEDEESSDIYDTLFGKEVE